MWNDPIRSLACLVQVETTGVLERSDFAEDESVCRRHGSWRTRIHGGGDPPQTGVTPVLSSPYGSLPLQVIASTSIKNRRSQPSPDKYVTASSQSLPITVPAPLYTSVVRAVTYLAWTGRVPITLDTSFVVGTTTIETSCSRLLRIAPTLLRLRAGVLLALALILAIVVVARLLTPPLVFGMPFFHLAKTIVR